MKNCNKCFKIKEEKYFYKVKGIINAMCKECNKSEVAEYRKTKEGVATSIFNTQCANSVKRGHKQPLYSKEEFKEWLFNHKKFDELYGDWVESGYKKNFKPSPDRKNNNLGYSFDNLRLVTCIENIRGKRVTFKKKDTSLLYPKFWLIKGFDDYYFTDNNLLINSRTNRFSKKTVRCCSVGYNLNKKFITLKNLKPLLIKVGKTSKNYINPKQQTITSN